MKLEEEIKQEKFKDPAHKLTVNIIFTYYWLVDRMKEALKPYDISMQQYNVLRILRGQGNNPASINLVKERMLDRSSDASRLVERLRVKGLVERVICPSDRRAVDIRISEKGLNLLKKIDEQQNSYPQPFDKLSDDKIEELNELLDSIRE
jgi:DNA-binding MarR family transcriptional regulator